MRKQKNKLISIIIPCRDEEQTLPRLISSIKKQTYSSIEIIVVDNNSLDKTKEIAKKFTNKVYNFGPERSAQRNFGAKKGKGAYFLFLDADMELTENVVGECIRKAKEDRKIAALVIPEKSYAQTYWEKVKAFERSFYNLEGDSLTDAARFFKREVFIKMDGYDESITGPEDWDLTERISEKGLKIERIKSVIYHYERIPSLFSLIKKKFYYGLGAQRYMNKHNVSIIGPKTIYFLRPSFYNNLDKIFSKPILSLGMVTMLSAELLAGGLGYLLGKIRRV